MKIETRSGRNASQDFGELDGFITLLRHHGVTSYLEVGARHGDTFFEVVNALPVGSVALAVDLPGGTWGIESSRAHLREAVQELRSLGYEATVIFGDSTSQKVIRAVEARGPFRAILIDGDHRYEGVKADWENYGVMGDMVAFHDIVGEGQSWGKDPVMKVEVPQLWAEIKATGVDTFEFVSRDSKMGIGVVLR